MQRRAAAAYAALFLLLAMGAYVMIGVSAEPAVTIDDPDITGTEGEPITVDGRTYNGSGIAVADAADADDRSALLIWVNESEKRTVAVENDTEVPAADVSWPGQTARSLATLRNGSTVAFNDSEYTLLVEDGEFTVQRGNQSESFGVGDTFPYRDNQTTVVSINRTATLAWGDPYTVRTRTVSNDSIDFRQSFNVTAILEADPAIDDETVTRADGGEYVVYRNGTTQPLSAYLPDPEVKTFSEGDGFTYDTADEGITYIDVTVEDVGEERVLLSWRGPVDHPTTLEHGTNVTLGPDDRQFVAHFSDNETLQLSTDIAGYQDQLAVQDSYALRINGLWGIAILSGLAAAFLIGMAYLPSRY